MFVRHNSPAALLDVKDLRSSGEIPLAKPDSAAGLPPVLVLGGSADVIVDVPGLHETADLLNTEAVVLPGMAHDMMLVSSHSLRHLLCLCVLMHRVLQVRCACPAPAELCGVMFAGCAVADRCRQHH